MEQIDLIATATFGLDAVVKRELQDLGYHGRVARAGRVGFTGDLSAIFRANINLRSAERILICLGQFEAKDFGELFDRTYELPWERWLGVDATFPVSGRSVRSQLSSVPACQKIVKKAVVKKLQAAHNCEDLPETGPKYGIEVALLDDMAMLTIDTTGQGLHKRGYRKLMGPAPLRETLASAMVQLSFWKPDRPLIDPFCGSGTIPIEAAMIGRDIAPGLNRNFTAEDWPQLPDSLVETARTEARDKIKPNLEYRIIGTDIDESVLSLARYHAKVAGVENDIHFQQSSFFELTSKNNFGCVICNPPYGERIGQREDVRYIYQSMPEILRRLPTWSHYVLTAWPDFEKVIGQEADRRRKLYNGKIECTYYQFHGPRPPKPGSSIGPISDFVSNKKSDSDLASQPDSDERQKPIQKIPAFGGLKENAAKQADMFAHRLAKNARHLRKWPTKQGITCYRLYDRDIPEIPLAVDFYEGRLHIAEYDRPHDRTPGEHGDWLDMLGRTAADALKIPPGDVYLKRRERKRGLSQYDKFSSAGKTCLVGEGGLKFKVNLSDYLDTGLFLDHRITRDMVRKSSSGLRVLNLFGYTGSFSVYAAAGGAKSVTTVDMSKTYLDWARENLAANRFTGPKYKFIRDDAMAYLNYHESGQHYDLAIVDPPTFSNSKKSETDFDIQRDHVELLNNLSKRMMPGSPVYFSTNFRKFKLSEPELKYAEIREISRQTVPQDFRNKKIHRCWLLKTRGGQVL